ncbi:glycosyltransferase family 2 protein [Candidatus Haliotispira prima]|uniref:Glycosyltransferase family 2 protein n=1 Tax=Candidatus Haliotispira prima TaxID=3034016 RepID=A0ABY8MIF8_9SPIO|nr:glycosyltransferase family 2 protein [Candidatus Haliotispira prima]
MKQIPRHVKTLLKSKSNCYCIIVPVINEGRQIRLQLKEMSNFSDKIDIIIADGGSTDDSLDVNYLKSCNVRVLLTKNDKGKLSAQLRMAYSFALEEGYEGIITIDGNGKDSIDSIPIFIEKLADGYDMIQGSRFVLGGDAVNTPKTRLLAIKLLHIPFISMIAGFKYTDTTNGYRGYSKKYLEYPGLEPFRDIFDTYELLAYLSVKAPMLGLKVCEVPVTRSYPVSGKVPTKISPIKGNLLLIKILWNLAFGKYNP